MKFVMLSHASRAATTRARTLARLAAAGVIPSVVESHYSGPHPDAEVRARAFDALALAEGDALVFLEDDIDVRPGLFHRHLGMAVAAGCVTAFCAVNKRHYPVGALQQAALPAHLAPIPNYAADRGFHGSMALYIPPAMVTHALLRRDEFQLPDGGPLQHPVIPPDFARGKVTGFDFWVKHTAPQFGGMLVALPNSVRHDDPKGKWFSPSFGIPEEVSV